MNPDLVQDMLMVRMPFLEKRAPFSNYHEIARPSKSSIDALHSVSPITPVSVGQWQKHLPRVAGQLQLHGPISEDLIEFGYEKDDSWLSKLDAVEPDTNGSSLPEYYTRLNLMKIRLEKYIAVIKTILQRCRFGRQS